MPAEWRRRAASHRTLPTLSAISPNKGGHPLLPVNGSWPPAMVVVVTASVVTLDGCVVGVVTLVPSVTTVFGTVVVGGSVVVVASTVVVVVGGSVVVVVASTVVVVVGGSVVVVVASTVVVVVGGSVVVVVASTVVVVVGGSVVVVVASTVVVVVGGSVVVVVGTQPWSSSTDVVRVACSPFVHVAKTVRTTVPLTEPGMTVVAGVEPAPGTGDVYPVTG